MYSRARVKWHERLASRGGVGHTPPSIDDQDPETWGTAPDQVAAQQRFMASIGPPAAPVERD